MAFNVFLVVWLMSVLLVSYYYESNLRAHLVRIDYQPGVETEKDILDQNRDLYMFDGTEVYNELARATTLTRQKLFQRMVERSTIWPLDIQATSVRNLYETILAVGE